MGAVAQAYPNRHARLSHTLNHHELLEIPALADLAESLPAKSIEYNPGAIPIGVRPEDVPENGLSIGETIRNIETTESWAGLRNVEQNPAYDRLLRDLLGELTHIVEPKTGKMMRPEAYIFISSPGAVTPFHFDPEHNILLQVRGRKDFHVFPSNDPRYAAHEEHERYHGGGHCNLPWQDAFREEGEVVHLAPGDAVFVPVMAPHYVKNGPSVSISLSITWRSQWSMDFGKAYAFNNRLRKAGLKPAAPAYYPGSNRARSVTERVIGKIAGR